MEEKVREIISRVVLPTLQDQDLKSLLQYKYNKGFIDGLNTADRQRTNLIKPELLEEQSHE